MYENQQRVGFNVGMGDKQLPAVTGAACLQAYSV